MTAIVTGAGGFLGSHLVDHLLAQGETVRAMVHYRGDGSIGWLEGIESNRLEIVRGDVRDRDSVREAVDECEEVYHLAALIGIPYSYQAPQSYLDTIAGGTLNVLQQATRAGARVLVVSSSEVYGTAQQTPMAEDHPLHPQSPYAAAKVAADMMAQAWQRSITDYGCAPSVVIARPFNAYGPRQSGRAVIPTIIRQALAGGPIRLGRTEVYRDWTFCADTVRGMQEVMERGEDGEVYHLASGVQRSVMDVVDEVGRILGKKLEIQHDAERDRPDASEVWALIGDASKAYGLGWSADVSLADGLLRTAEWLSTQRGSDPHRYEV